MMQLNKNVELLRVADEYFAVPVGESADASYSMIALSEPAWFMLTNMNEPKTKEELVKLITEEYDVDACTAEKDIDELLCTLSKAGVVYE